MGEDLMMMALTQFLQENMAIFLVQLSLVTIPHPGIILAPTFPNALSQTSIPELYHIYPANISLQPHILPLNSTTTYFIP